MIKRFLAKKGESKVVEIAEHIGLSPVRTRAILSQIVEVEALGENRNRTYRLIEEK